MPSAHLLLRASFSSLILTSPRLPASAASPTDSFLPPSFREEIEGEEALLVQRVTTLPLPSTGLTLRCRLVAQDCLTLLPKFLCSHSHRVTPGAPETTGARGATQAPGAEVGRVPLCSSECYQDMQACAVASWLTAALGGGLPQLEVCL